MRIKYINVEQKDFTFYLGVTPIQDLLDVIIINTRKDIYKDNEIQIDLFHLEESIARINEMKISAGLQRELVSGKINNISTYLETSNGIFPNSVIIDISDPVGLVSFENDFIEIPKDPSISISVLDGQHRLMGYKKYTENKKTFDKFDIPLTIFYNGDLEFQVYIFSTINRTQTTLNKSLLYDLMALTKNEVDDFKLAHEIASWLNTNNESILRNNFRMLGKGDGWLTQAAFIDYLLPNLLLNKSKSNYPVFLYYKNNKNYYKIAYFINDYFKAIINVYKDEFYSQEYIFKTSFIFGLFMKFLPYVFIYSLNIENYEYKKNEIEEVILKIKENKFDFRKQGINSGIGSSGKQNQLLNTLIGLINDQNNIEFKFNEYKKKYQKIFK